MALGMTNLFWQNLVKRHSRDNDILSQEKFALEERPPVLTSKTIELSISFNPALWWGTRKER